jgi:hypothetical protein
MDSSSFWGHPVYISISYLCLIVVDYFVIMRIDVFHFLISQKLKSTNSIQAEKL